MEPTPDTTIHEVRAYLRKHEEDGVACPCCGHYHRVYRRTITHSQVRFLAELYRRHRESPAPAEGVAVRDIVGQHMRGGDYGKLQSWGLIANVASGRWKPTQHGIAFLHGRPVPRYAYVKDNEVLRYGEESITVREAFQQPFDLGEILASGLPPRLPKGHPDRDA